MIKRFYIALFVSMVSFAASADQNRAIPVDWSRVNDSNSVPGELIVSYKSSADDQKRSSLHSKAGTQFKKNIRGLKTRTDVIMVKTKIKKLKDVAAEYEKDPDVAFVEPNFRCWPTATPNDPRWSELWGMRRINANTAWDTFTGSSNIVIGVIDTGVLLTHEDLRTNIWINPLEIAGNSIDDDGNGYIDDVNGWDFVNDDNDPTDDDGHGTHVAGTIGAVGNNGIGVVGVNWNIKIAALKFLGPNGGSTAGGIAAVLYTCNTNLKIRLTNNSWGGGGYSQALYDAIDLARQRDQLFIAAAGNSGTDNDAFPHYPSGYTNDNIIAVASIDYSGALSSFSCYGAASVDIAAPGGDIMSCWNINMPAFNNTFYNRISGTSMATPHVAGAAAFMLGMAPTLTYDRLRDMLYNGAAPNAACAGMMTTGSELDLVGAIQQLRGMVYFDRKAYRSDALAQMIVTNLLATQGVMQISAAWETTYPVAQIRASSPITLDRQVGTPAFTNWIQFVSGASAVHGDTLTGTYVNPDSSVSSKSVMIDDVKPVIIDPYVMAAYDTYAVVKWWTDEPASSMVIISTNLPLVGILPQGSPGYVETTELHSGTNLYPHTCTVTGLAASAVYYLAPASADWAGNTNTWPANLTSIIPGDYLLVLTRKPVIGYSNNMNKADAEWSVSNFTGGVMWQYGAPTFGPSAAHTGTNLWGTVLGGRYSNLVNGWVQAPSISVLERPTMNFWSWHDITATPGDYRDSGFVEVNAGSGWINVNSYSSFDSAYIHGRSNRWSYIAVDLSSFSNQVISPRFRLESDSADTAAGWYIDDMSVTYYNPPGVEVSSYSIDDTAGGDGDYNPEPGESFAMSLRLFNTDYLRAYTNVRVVVECSSPGVTLNSSNSVVLHAGVLAPSESWFSGAQMVVGLNSSVNYALFTTTIYCDNGGPWADNIRMEIGPKLVISGTVTNIANGAAIAGAEVRASASGYPSLTALTDLSGSYNLRGCVSNVTYFIYAIKPGSFSACEEITQVASMNISGVNFALGQAYHGVLPATIVTNVPGGYSWSTNLLLDNTTGTVDYIYSAYVDYTNALKDWISVVPAAGRIPAGTASNVSLTLSASNVWIGTYSENLVIDGNDVSGQSYVLPVTMTVDPSAILDLLSVAVSGGDGDAYAEPGETVDLVVTLANNGQAPVTNLAGTISTTSSFVNVTSSFIGDWYLPPATNGTPAVNPTISILPAATDDLSVDFLMVLTNDLGRVFSIPFTITVDTRFNISGSVTTTNGTPVVGAALTALSSSSSFSAVSGAGGTYTITGVDNDYYKVTCKPPLPYAFPSAQFVTVAGDLAGVNFVVNSWGLRVSPTNISVSVDEGRSTNVQLRVYNDGPVNGYVELTYEQANTGFALDINALASRTIDWDALNPSNCVMGELIVRFKNGVNSAQQISALGSSGVQKKSGFNILPASVVKVASGTTMKDAAEKLKLNPSVLYVEPNLIRQPYAIPDDPMFSQMWNLRNIRQTGGTSGADINVTNQWETLTGRTNVLIAVADTGVVRSHPDLASNIWYNPGEDWIVPGVTPLYDGIDNDMNGYTNDYWGWGCAENNSDSEPVFPDMEEGHAHGTHVAGTIGAVGNNGVGICGVNWTCRIVPLRITDDNGTITSEGMIRACQYIVANDIKVSNHSYGGMIFNGVESEAFAAVYANGSLICIAAGNDADNIDSHPKYPVGYNVPGIIAVAASDHDDAIANFSNYGVNTLDIAAPGVDIWSTIALPDGFGGWDYDYRSWPGTSMATPHVAGVAGLLLANAPWASADDLKNAIINGARSNDKLVGYVNTEKQLDSEGALTLLSKQWMSFAPAATNVDSGTSVVFNIYFNQSATLSAGSYAATLKVAQGENYTNVAVSLTVNPAPVPAINSYVIDDSAGDGDGYAEPGETVSLRISLTNNGSFTLYTPTATIANTNGGITMVSSNQAWSSMPSAGSGFSTIAAQFTVANGVPPTNYPSFMLRVTDSTHQPWLMPFNLQIEAMNSITGRVLNLTGAPVTNAYVEYWGASGGHVYSDSNGVFRINGLINGQYKVRALHGQYGTSSLYTNMLSGSDSYRDITVTKPVVTVSTTNISASLQYDQVSTNAASILNSASDPFAFTTHELKNARIALIADADQLRHVQPVLQNMGFTVDYYSNNYYMVTDAGYNTYAALYSSVDSIVFSYDMVIADATGPASRGRGVLSDEEAVYEEYLARGGKLMITGVNPLTKPDNEFLTTAAGITNQDRAVSASSSGWINYSLPVSKYIAISTGDVLSVSEAFHDKALVDTNQSAVAYISAGTDNKLVRRLTPEGGSVYIWTGNENADEWSGRGALQDIFKDIVLGEFQTNISWLAATSVSNTVQQGSNVISVTLSASGMTEGQYSAILLLCGNYPGMDEKYVKCTLNVELPRILVRSTTGVTNWMGDKLPGNGGAGSAMFQVLYAGTNNVIDPPQLDGKAGGDDVILRTYPYDIEFGRFGVGYPANPDEGKFSLSFQHGFRAGVPSATGIYVRAWDSYTVADSVAYGDSLVYRMLLTAGETVNFGSWAVNIPLGYPGSNPRDYNGDSIPDGWDVLNGRDPRTVITALTATGTIVSSFGTYGTANANLIKPMKVCYTDKYLFVLDNGNDQVKSFDRYTYAYNNKIGGTGSGDGMFSDPVGMGIYTVANKIAVADAVGNRIQVFSYNPTNGSLVFSSKFGSFGSGDGQFKAPNGVTFDSLGNIIVADTQNNRVQIFNSTNGFVRKFGSSGSGNLQFSQPTDVCTDTNGLIYVADTGNSRIMVFSAAGQYLSQLGTPGSGSAQLSLPRGVAVGVGGRIFVADTSNGRMQVFDSARNHLVAVGKGALDSPYGCAPVTNSPYVYVADTDNNRIVLFNTQIDVDADGMDDTWELVNGLNPATNEAYADSDGDGLYNIGEYQLELAPKNPDSDGDDMVDGTELNLGYDPFSQQYDILRVTKSDAASGSLYFRFTVQSNCTYQIRTCTDLVAGVWTVESTIVAPYDGILTYTNQPIAGGEKFVQPVKMP